MRRSRRPTGVVVASPAAVSALVLAACGSSGDSADENGTVTLTINVFGDSFSLPDNRDLYDEYEKAHDNVKIVENRSEFGTTTRTCRPGSPPGPARPTSR